MRGWHRMGRVSEDHRAAYELISTPPPHPRSRAGGSGQQACAPRCAPALQRLLIGDVSSNHCATPRSWVGGVYLSLPIPKPLQHACHPPPSRFKLYSLLRLGLLHGGQLAREHVSQRQAQRDPEPRTVWPAPILRLPRQRSHHLGPSITPRNPTREREAQGGRVCSSSPGVPLPGLLPPLHEATQS